MSALLVSPCPWAEQQALLILGLGGQGPGAWGEWGPLGPLQWEVSQWVSREERSPWGPGPPAQAGTAQG